MISGAQVRAARALLGWTAKELARKANVGISTVQRIRERSGAAECSSCEFGIDPIHSRSRGDRIHQR